MCWLVQGLRMAEWLVQKVTTERLENGGWKRGEVSLCPFCPSTVEAKDRSTVPPENTAPIFAFWDNTHFLGIQPVSYLAGFSLQVFC